MKTPLGLALLCLALTATRIQAQTETNTENGPKITITKKTIGEDGSSSSETIIKKGSAAANFDINAYLEANKADSVDIEIQSKGGDEERYIVINGSEGPKNIRSRNFSREVGRDVTREVERTVEWVDKQVKSVSGSWDNSNKAFLGVNEDDDTDEPGVGVTVVDNSAADLAGLKDGDIILQIDNTPVNRWNELTQYISDKVKGDVVEVTYLRNEKEYKTSVTLTNRNDVYAEKTIVKNSKKGFLGVSNMDDNGENPGVKVSIVGKSSAAKAGLKTGDVLLQMNDTPINEFEDIEDFMDDVKPGDKIRVKMQRGDKTETIEVTIGERYNWDYGQTDWNTNDIKVRQKEACLGICNAGDPAQNEGVSIASFTTISGAKSAGLQAGDVVLSIDNEGVTDLDKLWNELSKYKAGETVALEFLRDHQKHQTKVTLHACKDAYSQVTIYNADDAGNGSERRFFSWNVNEQDEESIRENRTIAIHKSDSGDASFISPVPGNESNPVHNERSLQLQECTITPNPSSGMVTIAFTGVPTPTVVTLHDLSGRQLFQEELNGFSGQYKQQFDLTEFLNGAVLLRIRQGDKFFTEHIVIG